MPRNMSFMLTTNQVRSKSKTVTRRLGWWFLKPGDLVMACEKCQGLKKGEKVNKLGLIRILRTDGVYLNQINHSDCVKEGFPKMTNIEFIDMFCKEMRCKPSTIVNRIEFEYIGALF